MNTHSEIYRERKKQSVANNVAQEKSANNTFQFEYNRPEVNTQRKLHDIANHKQPIQTKPNNTGLPDKLKTGIESLSGLAMDDVKVHYNSSKPATLQAHAFAQGTDIHLAAGQERHLPHEAWHVVQQKQGRVRPTMQMKEKVYVNDDPGLEKEADVMGEKAKKNSSALYLNPSANTTSQQKKHEVIQGKWAELEYNDWSDEKVQELRLGTVLNIKRSFFSLLNELGGYEEQKKYIQHAINKSKDSENTKSLFGNIIKYLRSTYESDTLYTAYDIVSTLEYMASHESIDVMMPELMAQFIDTSEIDQSDHGGDVDAPVEYIDWSEITPQGLIRIPDEVLFRVFYNLAVYHCAKARTDLPAQDVLFARYREWKNGGVYTRSMFKRMLGIASVPTDNTRQIVQLARKGNTYSFNSDYDGYYTGTKYTNVIYYRDGDGNINFARNPANEIAGFNKEHGQKITANSISWSYPMVDASEVQMSNDLADSEKGIMPSGKKVTLKNASRSQHFAIADMLYSNSRTGKLTWHHLSQRYKMILVDMRVHAKHGHNGGVHLWK